MITRPMYPPQKDSPSTFLTGNISATDTFIFVGNADVLPQEVPYPLTLGIDKTVTETIMVTEIGVGNNQLTVTRPAGALAWLTGTKVARVFNAADLIAVQQNLTDVIDQSNTNSTDLETLIDSLAETQEVVGDSTGGLVKELADEIERATTALQTESTRAQGAESVLNTNKVNRTELPQVLTDWEPNADGTAMTVTITRYNANSQTTSTFTRTIPLASDDDVGLMTPEAYSEIANLRSDVAALQQQGGKFIGVSFATKADLDTYTIPPTVKMGDFTYVLDDETQDDATTRYIFDGVTFGFSYVINYDPVGLATSTTPGIVKSDSGTTEGKVFVELDGTMSVIGWDVLTERITDIENSLLINTYPPVTTMDENNVLIMGGPDGTKIINAKDAGLVLAGLISPEQHRSIFRGKNLGSAPTPQQLAAIRDGSFTDLYIGDYWVAGGITYRIADMNYWINSGEIDNPFDIPHLVMVPDQTLLNASMEEKNITTNGYYGSAMRQITIPTINTTLQNVFGAALLTHPEYLSNASSDGRPSGASRYASIADLMQETQAYGENIFSCRPNGEKPIPLVFTTSKQQFALMQMVPKFVNPVRIGYWLRDIVSDSHFARSTSLGEASYTHASLSYGVRPCFAIG